MTKRFICLLLALCISMSLIALAATASQSQSSSEAESSEESSQSESSTEAESESSSASQSEAADSSSAEESQSESASTPAPAGNDITTPSEDDDVIGLLLDGAEYMSFNALRPVVRFQVPENLRGKNLSVYDYRTMPMLINNVEDVVSDDEGYVEIVLPSTGDFVVADVPFDAAYRLVLDLRYLDESLWQSAKTPDQAFDTDEYPIPSGDWVSSIEWREEEGLDPWPSLTAEPQPESDSSQSEQPEGDNNIGTTTPTSPSSSADSSSTAPTIPEIEQPTQPPKEFPLGSYVVVIVSAALGVFLVALFRTR